MNKIFFTAFLTVAFIYFAFLNETETATYWMLYAILFAIFDAREQLKKVK